MKKAYCKSCKHLKIIDGKVKCFIEYSHIFETRDCSEKNKYNNCGDYKRGKQK